MRRLSRILICAAAVAAATSCTVRPGLVSNREASFDGNDWNSGLIGYDGSGNRIITAHARDRYNALMDDYGKLFRPPVGRDEGMTGTSSNAFLLDAQHEFYFLTANRWRKNQVRPGSGR